MPARRSAGSAGRAAHFVHLCHLACKLFDAVSAPVKIGGLRLSVRPRSGIAVCPSGGASTAALPTSADAAMYAAKRDRSGCAFFACSGG